MNKASQLLCKASSLSSSASSSSCSPPPPPPPPPPLSSFVVSVVVVSVAGIIIINNNINNNSRTTFKRGAVINGRFDHALLEDRNWKERICNDSDNNKKLIFLSNRRTVLRGSFDEEPKLRTAAGVEVSLDGRLDMAPTMGPFHALQALLNMVTNRDVSIKLQQTRMPTISQPVCSA